MIARCGVGACQAKIKDGKLRFKQQFSNKLNDSWNVKKISSPKDRLYIKHLLSEVNGIFKQQKQKVLCTYFKRRSEEYCQKKKNLIKMILLETIKVAS